MTTRPADVDLRRNARAAWAVFAVFAASGATFATWVSRLPAVRDGLDFTPGQMGVLLLTGAVGSVVALPLSGMITARLGAARAVTTFALVAVAGYALVCVGVGTGTALAVRVGLVVAGIGFGVWDAAMNVEGAVVEQRLGRSIMPRFHAGFSLGTVAGAGVGSLAAHAGVPFVWHVGVGVALTVTTALVCVRGFLPTPHAVRADVPEPDCADPAEAAPAHGLRATIAAWREPRTLLVGFVVLAAALTEGAANDWTALSLVDGFGAAESTGAFALALFLAAMTVTRLAGTRLVDRFGRVTVLRAGSVAALVGVAVFAFAPWLWLAVVGSVVWGASAALGFPLGMSAAADEPQHAAMRVAVVSTIGYAAFFVGPALIGLVADVVGFRHALVVIALPVVVGLALAGNARPLRAERTA
ncbi:major facilitator superfamily MFS_1 [Xylanimonas cellulosilytica DSM 15894]|uniref:Major facilitator superfamily MFS_1 n=1 Tax=Xylanimonas cellulosilytica (strain DSM 15894 / JCM 12276 / CECT 5975 / KCTC 9989 / LMG 20990 / NBRC 107835 / XIL07) TaxID=446471 RepID=D1BWQ9_XYLCX|nr:MFS transporter [Xylanimonas cellulosilytica]ACZ29641.1 major facilitator superfamily MFS_1 [Xylanimonas cellulosilytica DSM 15894]